MSTNPLSDPSSAPLKLKPRASERVRQYLEARQAEAKGEDRIKLPPVQELSRHLKVSTATIYHIFKDLVEEGRMQTVAGRGSYLMTRPARPEGRRPLCIGLTLDIAPASSRWSGSISHAILQAVTTHHPNLNLRPLPGETLLNNTHQDALIREVDEVDALIFFPSAETLAENEKSLTEFYESRKKPVVRFGSPNVTAGTNFVAFDHFEATSKLGYAWAKSGRKRIAYLVRESINAGVATLLSLIGLQSGATKGGPPSGVQVIQANSILEEEGYRVMQETLRAAPPPDAIFCYGDFLAIGALRALREAGLNVPQDVSIVGGSGLDLSGTIAPDLTRLSVPFETAAEQLIQMALERIRRNGDPLPGVYIPMGITDEGSTTEQENRLLRKTAAFV